MDAPNLDALECQLGKTFAITGVFRCDCGKVFEGTVEAQPRSTRRIFEIDGARIVHREFLRKSLPPGLCQCYDVVWVATNNIFTD